MILDSIIALKLLYVCAIFDPSFASDLKTHIPPEFEVIIPRVFHHDNKQELHPSHESFHNIYRQRRSVSTDIFINITTDNEEFHIKLVPNDKLLSPGFKVYHRHGTDTTQLTADDVISDDDDVTTGSDITQLSECLFKGQVLSHDDAPAAFSLCNGVTGVLMFPHDDYVIEPLPSHMDSLQRHHHHQHQHNGNHNSKAKNKTKSKGNKVNGTDSQSHVYINQSDSRNNDLDHGKESFDLETKNKSSYHGDKVHHHDNHQNDIFNDSISQTHSDQQHFAKGHDLEHPGKEQEAKVHDLEHPGKEQEAKVHDLEHPGKEERESDLNHKQYSGQAGTKTVDNNNSQPVQRHILYKRSALHQHQKENYQTSIDFNKYAKTGQMFHRARRKRSYRRVERSVETLVVVDQDMYRSHGRENITTYVLSIFNIVSQLYQDTTLGYPINVVLVGLVFLDGQEPGLHITNHADKTLNSFCQWQAGIHNGRKKLHDHAVLLTGKDICSYQNAPCDTLGFAPIDGMCSELRSCIVNEDTGLSTAFTVAHEMGHNFGMMHDGDGNTCKDASGFIMSPTLAAQSGTFHWSSCSRQYMRNFLNAVQSECLTSQSRGTAELKFPNKQPGEIFDADTQCKWQFGSHSKQCTIMFGRDPCMNLFCHKREGMCETKFLPAAEGTSCGSGMWCQQARCVSYGKKGPAPINGWWTEWGSWTQCTRSCGGGIKTRTRECNNPRPQYGGKTCVGSESMHKMCNLLECERTDPDFREMQCKQLVQNNYRGWDYRWRSYRQHTSPVNTDAEDQCKLYCKADRYNFFYAMPHEVTDGTRCNQYTTDVCVQGRCQHIGCDLQVGSSARKDSCGVCQGDNTSCKIVNSTFLGQPKDKAYLGVVYLPRGSSSIKIEEVAIARSNYLALRNTRGNYYLNGQWKLDSEGVYHVAGTKFIYRRSYNNPESLSADGPLLEELVLEVLVQSENPGIKYSFTVPKSHNSIPHVVHNYTWSVVLTECSRPCAGGEQIVTAHCHRDQGEEVEPAYCAEEQKPGTGSYPCNTQPCRPRWVAEPWSVCNKRCGGGKQRRHIYCVQRLSSTEDRKLPRKYCDHVTKPTRKRECNTQECPPVWYKGPWSKCSATCGKGVKSRTVVCRSKTSDGQVILPVTMCAGQQRPSVHKGCRIIKCPDPTAQWTTTSWTECTSTCGVAVKSRLIKCTRKTESGKTIITRDQKCEHLPLLNVTLTEKCELNLCPVKPQWFASPWSQCSVTCGQGIQTRLVHCMQQQYRKLSSNCDQKNKPSETKSCVQRQCASPGPECVDEFSWCHLVPKHNICDHSFYGTKCCLSCHNT